MPTLKDRIQPLGWWCDRGGSTETWRRSTHGYHLMAQQVHGTKRWKWTVGTAQNGNAFVKGGYTGKQQLAIVAANTALKGLTNGGD
jgi:hypothetical protein